MLTLNWQLIQLTDGSSHEATEVLCGKVVGHLPKGKLANCHQTQSNHRVYMTPRQAGSRVEAQHEGHASGQTNCHLKLNILKCTIFTEANQV